ncbi:uncharacterized protein F4822DRAFT_386386 [Hypoxylon trugodes]|uniref:uncharacterized protein n=1 Tax=Hypoxylon trugodes TaxID=326681 RepID=UPI00219298DE|nr:uncharacterized protein F4822DRAFT_386386 [Hypoxylon trugodes]KAI1393922.1 hypothetical protein F4822DRAFT_386386 [Hypoxylon trugodes]
MSSMLKKTGGLSFKPKVAPRRPAGAASSKPPPASTPSGTTEVPATGASSQAPTTTPTAAVAPPIESSGQEPERTPVETPREPPKETPRIETEKPPTQSQPTPITPAPSQPAPTSTANSAPTPTPIDKPVSLTQPTPTPAPPTLVTSEPRRPLPSAPVSARTERTTRPTPAPEVSSLRSPPATQPEKTTASASSTAPTAATSRSGLFGNTPTPTPDPPVPIQARVGPPTAPPSPAPVADTIAVSAAVDEPPSTIPKKKRAYRKRKPATTTDETGAEVPAPKKRRTRKNATAQGDGTAAPDGEGEGEAEEGTPATKKRRRGRSPTPEEDPEDRTVDHTTMKMAELTRDLGIGKRFKHADAIAERAREARERFRRKKLEKQKQRLGLTPNEDSASRAGTPAEGEEGGRESAVARARDLGANATSGAQQSVGYEVIDGQIIINQQSLVVDRHAAHRDMGTLETVEEDEFSHLTTSASFRRESRKTGPNYWSEEDTEKFYRLLGMFGTDFDTISGMFPEKTRRAVKLKFNREETLRPRRINATVMVRGEKKVNIDLEEYKSHQTEWQESDKILAEHAELRREQDEDIRRLREERRAQGLLDDDDDEVPVQGEGANGNGSGDGDAADVEGDDNGLDAPVDAEVAITA